MKARRLPLLVDAFQWNPPAGNVDDIEAYAQREFIEPHGLPVNVGCDLSAELRPMDGSEVRELDRGDWIIRREREDGRECIYAISDDAFRAGYTTDLSEGIPEHFRTACGADVRLHIGEDFYMPNGYHPPRIGSIRSVNGTGDIDNSYGSMIAARDIYISLSVVDRLRLRALEDEASAVRRSLAPAQETPA